MQEPKTDNVNHPSHYETGKFECFDVMVEAIGVEETKGFCLCVMPLNTFTDARANTKRLLRI